MLRVHSLVFNALEENTYIIDDPDTRVCAIVDPGCYVAQEKQMLRDFIDQHGLQVHHLINTHAHIDHILGNKYVKETYGVALALHQEELPILQAAMQYGPIYGFADYEPTEATILLTADERIQIGNHSLELLHVPGHSPGHIALYSREGAFCISGDVLFRGNIGRTDLPGGDHATLLQSIRQQLFPLGDEVTIYPGHGPTTTIGLEKEQLSRLYPGF